MKTHIILQPKMIILYSLLLVALALLSACSRSYTNEITIVDDLAERTQAIYINCEEKENDCFYTLSPGKKVVIDNVHEVSVVKRKQIYVVEFLNNVKATLKLSALLEPNRHKDSLKQVCKRVVLYGKQQEINCATGKMKPIAEAK